jgi:hypothetical protein
LVAYGNVVGALILVSNDTNGFDEQKIALASLWASFLALALDRKRQSDESQRKTADLTRMASFPEMNPSGIVEIDLNGRVCYRNPSAVEMFPGCEDRGDLSPILADLPSLAERLQASPKFTMMRERKVDGVRLDGIGARPWGRAEWTTWSTTEKNLWTDGAVDLVRRLDAKRRAINPNFLLVNNNVWDLGYYTRGVAGEKYVDGLSIEHPPAGLPAYHRTQAGKAYSNLGQRRVFVIARDATEARAWAAVKGVTHVSSQVYYKYPTVPPISFKALYDR